MSHYLIFSAADNPMYLSKVGNWVITFLSPKDAVVTELALTCVIPRQNLSQLQPRRVTLRQCDDHTTWQIQSLECYTADLQSDISVDIGCAEALQTYAQIAKEFDKYDVEIEVQNI